MTALVIDCKADGFTKQNTYSCKAYHPDVGSEVVFRHNDISKLKALVNFETKQENNFIMRGETR